MVAWPRERRSARHEIVAALGGSALPIRCSRRSIQWHAFVGTMVWVTGGRAGWFQLNLKRCSVGRDFVSIVKVICYAMAYAGFV